MTERKIEKEYCGTDISIHKVHSHVPHSHIHKPITVFRIHEGAHPSMKRMQGGDIEDKRQRTCALGWPQDTPVSVEFPCEECAQVFPSNATLSRHKKTIHKGSDKFWPILDMSVILTYYN